MKRWLKSLKKPIDNIFYCDKIKTVTRGDDKKGKIMEKVKYQIMDVLAELNLPKKTLNQVEEKLDKILLDAADCIGDECELRLACGGGYDPKTLKVSKFFGDKNPQPVGDRSVLINTFRSEAAQILGGKCHKISH